jgi:hypothetical protein
MSGIEPEDMQQAFDSAVAGDFEPLVSLFAPGLEWRGQVRGHWLWRTAPA